MIATFHKSGAKTPDVLREAAIDTYSIFLIRKYTDTLTVFDEI